MHSCDGVKASQARDPWAQFGAVVHWDRTYGWVEVTIDGDSEGAGLTPRESLEDPRVAFCPYCGVRQGEGTLAGEPSLQRGPAHGTDHG